MQSIFWNACVVFETGHRIWEPWACTRKISSLFWNRHQNSISYFYKNIWSTVGLRQGTNFTWRSFKPICDQEKDSLFFLLRNYRIAELCWSTIGINAYIIMAAKDCINWLLLNEWIFSLFTDRNNFTSHFNSLTTVANTSEAKLRKAIRKAVKQSTNNTYNYIFVCIRECHS